MAEAVYQVSLDRFSGPLDLLLFLVRKEEVNIQEISLARIADQYQLFLEEMSEPDLDHAGDFLVLAGALVEIKARLLLPQTLMELGEGEEEEDPRVSLIRQLLQFRVFKEAALALERRREAQARHHPVFIGLAPDPGREAAAPEPEPVLEEMDLYRIAASFKRISDAVGLSLPRTIVRDDTPQEVYRDRIRQALADQGEVGLWALAAKAGKLQLIGFFLALLEMARQREIAVVQAEPFGEIRIRAAD